MNAVNTKVHGMRSFAMNPYNAIACVGDQGGVVSMWTPNAQSPVAKVLCHKAPIVDIAFDPAGR